MRFLNVVCVRRQERHRNEFLTAIESRSHMAAISARLGSGWLAKLGLEGRNLRVGIHVWALVGNLKGW